MSAMQTVALVYHVGACVAVVLLCLARMTAAPGLRPSGMPAAAIYLTCVGAFAYLVEPLVGWRPNVAVVLLETGVVLLLLAVRSRSQFVKPKRGHGHVRHSQH